jgi:hypothetical protein
MKRLYLFFLAASVCLVGIAAPATSADAAGSISGTATDATSGAPISGLSVCAEENFVGGVHSGCTTTDASGHYLIGGLPAGGNYQVEFSAIFPMSPLNFLTQYWQGKEGLDNWDAVTVVDGATTEGINAAMKPGATIAGKVSESGTGAALADVRICVLDPAPTPRAEEFERCETSDAGGNYVVRSLPAGTYVVAFSHYPPLNPPSPLAEQYYAGATSKATATPITIAPPESRTGIDASLINGLRTTLHRARGFRTVTRQHGVRVGFRFLTADTSASFVCKRDRGPWRRCRSPQRFWASIGRHVFRVRAVAPDGLKGPIAKSSFRVTRRAAAG